MFGTAATRTSAGGAVCNPPPEGDTALKPHCPFKLTLLTLMLKQPSCSEAAGEPDLSAPPRSSPSGLQPVTFAVLVL